MKKYYILAFTFLCLLIGQSTYASDWNELDEVVVTGPGSNDSNDPCDPFSTAYDYFTCNPDPGNGSGYDSGDPCDYYSSAYNQYICDSNNDSWDPCDPSSSAYNYSTCYGDNGGTTNPQPEPNQTVDPCDKNQQTNVKNQIADQYLAAKLAQVKSSLQPPNTLKESGFPVYKNANGNNIAGTLSSGTSTTPSVSIGFSTSNPAYIPSAIVHSHPSGVYANPSAGDIYGLIGLYSTVNTVKTSYIVAADGTTYAMVVTNPTALASFKTTYPASANQSNDSFTPNSPTYNLYRTAYLGFTNSGLSDAVAEERANAVVMAQAGINLLKAPANSTDFKQIQGTKVTDSSGNVTFTKSDCP